MGYTSASGRVAGRPLAPVLGVLAVGALGGIAASLILLHREVALAIICFLVAPLPIFVRIAQRKFDRSSRSRSSRSRS